MMGLILGRGKGGIPVRQGDFSSLQPEPEPDPQGHGAAPRLRGSPRRYAVRVPQRGAAPLQPPPPLLGAPVAAMAARPAPRRVRRYQVGMIGDVVDRDGWDFTPEMNQALEDGMLPYLFQDSVIDSWFEADDGSGRVVDIRGVYDTLGDAQAPTKLINPTSVGKHRIYKEPIVKKLPRITIYEDLVRD